MRSLKKCEHLRDTKLVAIVLCPECATLAKASLTLLAACKSVLESLDVGGEQSLAFADEIATLKAAIEKAGG